MIQPRKASASMRFMAYILYNRGMTTKTDGLMDFLDAEIAQLKAEGRFVKLRVLTGHQAPVSIIDGKKVVNLTSNNYLDLTGHPKLKAAAKAAIDSHGVGTAAVRPIIGTQDLHLALEQKLARFKGTESALVFQSGFTVNVACCQSLMSDPKDLLISDELNHASIIDGARLAKAARKVYPHKDMKALQAILESPEALGARRKMIVTDGVFSMDGDLAPLPEIVELAEKYGAFVMVDDAHASGVMGENGRGTPNHFKVGPRQTASLVLLQQVFDLKDVVRNLPAQARPTDHLRLFHALPADMDDVVFNLHGAELRIALGLVPPDRIGRFEIETCGEQAFKHLHPRAIFAVVEREGQNAARLQDSVGLAPTLRQDALIEGLRILALAIRVFNRFQGLRREWSPEYFGVVGPQNWGQPHIKEIRKLRILDQLAERRVGDDHVDAIDPNAMKVCR